MKHFRPKVDTYNSGVLYVCRPPSAQSSFAAAKNTVKASDLKKIAKLDYEEKSKRMEDIDFAQRDDHTLAMKVKTRYLQECASVKNQVLIGNTLYGIIKIDEDRAAGAMYMYLEEIRRMR